jgi:hypothetical protein
LGGDTETFVHVFVQLRMLLFKKPHDVCSNELLDRTAARRLSLHQTHTIMHKQYVSNVSKEIDTPRF